MADKLQVLRSVAAAGAAPKSAARSIRTLLDLQSAQWARGEPATLEELLRHIPASIEDEDVSLDLIHHELILRRRAGETPQPADYVGRFPHLARQIERMLEVEWYLVDATLHAQDAHFHISDADQEQVRTNTIVHPLVEEYVIEGVLGRGGMGVVYRARHIELKRPAALKMLITGAEEDTAVLARFHAEADAVAKLQHANIVQIYDVGESAAGPYLAFELIEGQSLAAWAAASPQPARLAAEIVEKIAHAVHYAHARGVVHRDLKPGNVLMTADGEPKVTDFGLAKRLAEDWGHTGSKSVLGTPSYMAPEQAAGGSLRVGAWTDVYGLGAILYELVSGRPPFKAETPLETLRQVTSAEVVPPGRLRPGLSRDLQTICLKCLEKETHRRYASAAALADDLRRYLEGRPILARPISPVGRAAKWARRQPIVAALAGFLLVAAATLIAGGAYYQLNLQKAYHAVSLQKREAEVQRGNAMANLKRARIAADRLLADVGNWGQFNVPQADRLRRKLLEDAAGIYREMLNEDSQDPELRYETSAVSRQLGNISTIFKEHETAEKSFRNSMSILQTLVRDFPQRQDYRLDLARCLNELGSLLRDAGRIEEARDHYSRALELMGTLAAADPGNPTLRKGVALYCDHLAYLTKAPDDVERLRRRGLESLKKLAVERPDDLGCQSDLAGAYNNLGNWLMAKKRLSEAETCYRDALAVLERLWEASKNNQVRTQELAGGLMNWGAVLSSLGRHADAVNASRRARDLFEELITDHPEIPEYKLNFVASCRNCASIEPESSDVEKWMRQALTQAKLLADKYPRVPRIRAELAGVYADLGEIRRRQGRLSEGRNYLEESVAHHEAAWAVLRDENSAALLASARAALAKLSKPDESEARSREAQPSQSVKKP
jgi:tetratricopeptide (TPR) repeat protein